MQRWVTTMVRDTPGGESGTAADVDMLFRGRTWTNIRIWVDEILAISQEASGKAITPSLQLRIDGLSAVFADQASRDLNLGQPGQPVQLLVIEDRCGTGPTDPLRKLLSWPSWNALKEYLGEYGYDQDIIDEAISPTNFEEAQTKVDREKARQYIRSDVDPTLLKAVLQYFSEPIHSYLDGWGTLSAHVRNEDGSSEILVPREAIIQAQWQ